MEIEAIFTCAFCFEENATLVDWSAGEQQEYVEDCQVCCRPNLLHIKVGPEQTDAEITAEIS